MHKSVESTPNYRWVILAMTTLTGFITMGFQTTSLAALFSEIAESVNLDLIQIGLVWGVGTIMGIVTSVIGGSLVDYFGTRRSLVTLCIVVGITGALRAFAVDFWSLLFFSFLFGVVQPVIPMNLVKLNRQWFPSEQLGLASGIMSAGFATGLMLGSRLSATVLSPMLGGWRGVLILLGVLAVILGLVWFVIHPPVEKTKAKRPNLKLVLENLRFVTRYRELWVYGLARFGILGLMRGVVGYVPTYLREIGWDAPDADTAITLFFFASLIGVIPLSHLSDRIGNRRIVIIVGVMMMSMGTGLMFFAGDVFWSVMVAMVIGGFFFDTCMALTSASITEIEGLDISMVGSALGFAFMMHNLSATIMPPLGNALSTFGLNVPFLLWACSGLIAVVALVSYRGDKSK
jgi:MFS family permease